ncbi:unnamed protein product [Adineta steineri]|uniref:G-protein coupled receptors family 1 profile domain-containing protein n=1 Tax=Adineta steineri TaxID=433720 RepID=A0A819BG59_9BILA|nr:unnamed protein product [Adineta steineri]CAF1433917.1 unnamed protein product [Adineta steineri]CAF1488034.1 unnamed protein product [Adineta steineri]CAF3796234.1 unnamed protein product [Adineta steineri]CAF4250417.1 unnamed protein product [Adineta steineri]
MDSIRFWSYLLLLIPSIICSLFVLYNLLFIRTLRLALNNHIFIVLLFVGLLLEVTIYPWMLFYYHFNGIWQRSVIFCQIWGFLDWGVFVLYIILLAWATIERHILIFHDRWVSTKTKRMFLHYLPIVFLILYGLIFYIIIYFFSPCETMLLESPMICFFPCLLSANFIIIWDGIIHQIVTVLTIAIFSIALLVRIVWQKYRIHRAVDWRKHRKMTIQLLSTSILFVICYLPFTTVYIVNLCGISRSNIQVLLNYSIFLTYLTVLLFPFVCALSLSELRTKLIKIFKLHRQTNGIGRAPPVMRFTTNNRVGIQ